ncbi:MAG: 4-hydroxy-3-methylbut-2-enyl diphosphate reductase [Candidatus Omnitrophica bacterium]|nr:4-hydroxy-3-methylbut-2-enyl diphosphate reductase [Candidatus Omnitrophota bacterium]MCM8823592.1 4-hydroxy-3-methylbut-2-enyl diphosphate reductase [Candidatus Omnitrophota bacterium]MCM8826288.1 4-hydroxy-3-methylbut-2-enyl diphosphate reductase [Candidatus Omnitrophota bacterium]
MKIILAKSAGFCFGVRRAIQIAEVTAKKYRNVYMSGEIVHNELVIERLKQLGIKKIKKLGSGKDKIFLVRAHGEPKKRIEKANNLGYKIIDATCPMVKEIHKIAQREESNNRKIIVVGDKNHDEVLGILGQLKYKSYVIEPNKKFISELEKLKDKPCSVVVQSTQDLEMVKRIFKILKRCIKDIRFFNTICKPTQQKQIEIKKIAQKTDTIIVIGSKTSANTKRLYQIAKSINKKTYWIEDKSEIKKNWFKNINSIGITAGASTPKEVIDEVINIFDKF